MKKASFISDMMAHYRRSAFGPNDVAAVSDLKLRVQEVASQSANKARVELFGSLVSGFCKPGSDADLSMTYRNFSPWLQGLSRVSDQDNRRLMRFSRVAAENGFEEVKYIRARIPVVQFVDPVSGIHCDLSIGNLGGVQNSQILHAIHNMYPDFYSAYIHVVKEWGKAREVVCPAKVTFNSFTITTMSLMVLQELGLLPIFRPTGELGELLLSDAQRDIEAFSLPPLYKTLEGDDQKLGEAVFFCFQRFADYYSKFDFTQGTVSLMYPRRHRKVYADIVAESMRRFEAKKRAAWVAHIAATPDDGPFNEKDFAESIEHEKVQRVSNTPFVVEDFVNYVNSGRRAQPSRAPHILSEFSRLAQLLHREDDLSFEEVFTVSNVVPNFRSPGQPDHRVSTFDTSHG